MQGQPPLAACPRFPGGISDSGKQGCMRPHVSTSRVSGARGRCRLLEVVLPPKQRLFCWGWRLAGTMFACLGLSRAEGAGKHWCGFIWKHFQPALVFARTVWSGQPCFSFQREDPLGMATKQPRERFVLLRLLWVCCYFSQKKQSQRRDW